MNVVDCGICCEGVKSHSRIVLKSSLVCTLANNTRVMRLESLMHHNQWLLCDILLCANIELVRFHNNLHYVFS